MRYNELERVGDCWDRLPITKQILWCALILYETWDMRFKSLLLGLAILIIAAGLIFLASHNWAAGLVAGVLVGLIAAEIIRSYNKTK